MENDNDIKLEHALETSAVSANFPFDKCDINFENGPTKKTIEF